MAEPRLIDRVFAQIPRRLRGRLDVEIKADPYYLRTEVIVTGSNGVPYSSGPIAVKVDSQGRFVDCQLPDWFLGHMALIPVDNNRLSAQLWDSMEDEPDLAAKYASIGGFTIVQK